MVLKVSKQLCGNDWIIFFLNNDFLPNIEWIWIANSHLIALHYFNNLHLSFIRYLSMMSVLNGSQENLRLVQKIEFSDQLHLNQFLFFLNWTKLVNLEKVVMCCYVQVYEWNFPADLKVTFHNDNVSACLEANKTFVHVETNVKVKDPFSESPTDVICCILICMPLKYFHGFRSLSVMAMCWAVAKGV